MLGIIIYEICDIIYNVVKIGYNCIDFGINSIYGKKPFNEIDNARDMEGKMYLERILKLEEKIRHIEQRESIILNNKNH
jgi:hypothetical protein